MKKSILMMACFFCIQGYSSPGLKCTGLAKKAAAKEMEISLETFGETMSVVWSCKLKADPSSEEIQFSDGSNLVGVSTKIVNGKCTVTDVFTGQDDGDGDAGERTDLCL